MSHRRWMWACGGAGLLILPFVLWMMQGAASRKVSAEGRWQERMQQIRTLTKGGKMIPSADLLKNLQNQRQAFGDKLDNILTILGKSEKRISYNNALEFKGALFNIQKALLATAKESAIRIPPDIGFEEFTGKAIPAFSQLDDLSFQLAKIQEFLRLLIECRVAEIRELRRGVSRVSGQETVFSRASSFDVHFFCSQDSFHTFLAKLLQANSIFVLDSLEAHLQSRTALEVRLTVRAIAFPEGEGEGSS